MVFPDILEVKAEPPGPAVSGQKFHYVRRIDGKDVHFFYELTEVTPNKSWRGVESSPRLFRRLEDFGRLTPIQTGTKVDVEYELSKDSAITEQTLRDGLQEYWENAKRLVEKNAGLKTKLLRMHH